MVEIFRPENFTLVEITPPALGGQAPDKATALCLCCGIRPIQAIDQDAGLVMCQLNLNWSKGVAR
jgi:hypothetical protein